METKKILQWLVWLGLYGTLLIPFIVADGMFFPYITGKAFTFRIIVEIIFGLWLILAMLDRDFRPKWSWLLGVAGIFTFALLIADINAVAPYKAFWSNYERMEGWVTFAHLLVYLLVMSSMINKEKLWLWFLRANVLAATILGLTSISQAVKAEVVRFAGPLGNPIYIAVYFLFILFFTLILMYKDVLTKEKVYANFLLYVYLAVSALSIFVMYRASRGALLGAIGGLFVAAVLTAIFEKERKLIRQVAIGGIVAVIVLIGVFFSVRQADFVQNNPTLKRFAEISWNNLNGQARQLVWPMALRGFQEKPILGWGQEGFNYVFNKYYDPGMYAQEAWFDRAHNAPLDFLVAGGILGFLSYLALFGSALYLLWLRKNTMSITERALLTGALAGYLFQAIFVFDNLVSYLLLFTTFAYIHARSTEGKEFSTRGGYLSQIISNEEYRNYILIPLVVILTGTAVYFVNVPGIKANHTLIQAFRLIQGGQPAAGLQAFKTALSYQTMGDAEIREQLLSYTPSVLRAQGIDQNLKKEFLTLTINEINKQINRVPNDARYYILMGSLLNNIGSSSEALTYIRKAVELSPRKQLMRFELINSLYTLGKYDEALAEAKSAYELDTRYDQARSLYESLSKERTKK